MDFTIEKQYIIKLLFNNLQLNVPERVGLDKSYKFRYENKVLELMILSFHVFRLQILI